MNELTRWQLGLLTPLWLPLVVALFVVVLLPPWGPSKQ